MFEEEMFYAEFDPRDFPNGISQLIDTLQGCCLERFNTKFDQYEITIGKLHNNASLYWFKTIIKVDKELLSKIKNGR